jgi:hypothetical protein
LPGHQHGGSGHGQGGNAGSERNGHEVNSFWQWGGSDDGARGERHGNRGQPADHDDSGGKVEGSEAGGEGLGHWLFSDMCDIDIQYAESALLSIDNIEKRYAVDRFAENCRRYPAASTMPRAIYSQIRHRYRRR